MNKLLPDMLTVRETAALLRYSPRAVRLMCHRGKLRWTQLGGASSKVLIFADSVRSLLGIRAPRRVSDDEARRRSQAAMERMFGKRGPVQPRRSSARVV